MGGFAVTPLSPQALLSFPSESIVELGLATLVFPHLLAVLVFVAACGLSLITGRGAALCCDAWAARCCGFSCGGSRGPGCAGFSSQARGL